MLPDCLLFCQQCKPYNLVKQANQKTMAITQVIDFSTPLGRWTFIVTPEITMSMQDGKIYIAKFLFHNLQSSLVYWKDYISEFWILLFWALIDPLCIQLFSLIPNLESSDHLLCYTQIVSSAVSTLNLEPWIWSVLNSVIKGLFPIFHLYPNYKKYINNQLTTQLLFYSATSRLSISRDSFPCHKTVAALELVTNCQGPLVFPDSGALNILILRDFSTTLLYNESSHSFVLSLFIRIYILSLR